MILKYFVPEGLPAEIRDRFRMVTSIAAAIMIFYILFSPADLLQGRIVSAADTLGCAVLVFFSLLYLKKSRKLNLFSDIFIAIVYSQLTLSLLLRGGVTGGGTPFPAAFYLFLVPMIAMIIRSRNSGFFWAAVVIATYIIIISLSGFIEKNIMLYPVKDYMAEAMIYLPGAVVIIAALTSVLINIQQSIKKELEIEKASIEIKVLEATEQLQKEKDKEELQSRLKIESQKREAEYVNLFIQNLLNGFEKFSKGDLTVELSKVKVQNIDNPDLVESEAKLVQGFNDAVKNIQTTFAGIVESIKQTADSASTISASIEQMAAGSMEQSSQTAEVAGAVEEMTKTIFDSAANASKASHIAKDAGESAKEGGRSVRNSVEGMNRVADVVLKVSATVNKLGKNSEQIGEIIQVIDEIADQTNLLALNAAIEAARAGEQGRGFAVVADEVRKLAERTTKATKEISQMIDGIQKDTRDVVKSIDEGTSEVQKGVQLSEMADESLKGILSGAEKVVDVINQVAAASEEQSATAEEIRKNIDAINQIVNETTAGIHQASRAVSDLSSRTEHLKGLILQFKIGGTSAVRNYVTAPKR